MLASQRDEAGEAEPAPRTAAGRTVEIKAGAHGHFYSRIYVNA
jgi:hypothetical protein